MIPEGAFPATVLEWQLGRSGKGTEQVAITFGLDAEPVAGQTIVYYGSFSEAAAEYTIRNLRTMGWKGDDLSDLSEVLDGKVEVVIQHEEWENKLRAKVKFINPLGGGAALKEPLSEAEAKSFAAKMKAKVRAVDAMAGKPKANGAPAPKGKKAAVLSPEPPYDNPRDGEIPF